LSLDLFSLALITSSKKPLTSPSRDATQINFKSKSSWIF